MWNGAPIRLHGRSAVVYSVVVLSLPAIAVAFAGDNARQRPPASGCRCALATGTASAELTSTRARSAGARRAAAVRQHHKRVRRGGSACARAAQATAAGSGQIATVGHEAAHVVPSPIACRGYHQVFRDNFTTLNRKVWDDHIWYDDPPEARWSGFQETDRSGILHLRSSSRFTWHNGQSSGTWPINTISTHDAGLAFRRGYFEARIKYSYAGDAAWPAFWLLGERGANNDANYPKINPYCARHRLPAAQCYNAELDVLDNGGRSNEDYFVLHRNTSSLYGVKDKTNDPAWRTLDYRPGDAWHTYSALWTTDRVTWYRDGHRVASTRTYDSTNQPMFLLLQNWIGAPDRWGPRIRGTDSDVQVDYVTVWQK